ncbi:MAG: DUF960 family protein [Clostridium paraputrificum]
MFDKNNRYMTRGIQKSIDIGIQLLLWNMIDEMEGQVDYLQVFEIKNLGDQMVKIVHRQEVPKYSKEYEVIGVVNYDVTIFVVDSGKEGCVMMLNWEY